MDLDLKYSSSITGVPTLMVKSNQYGFRLYCRMECSSICRRTVKSNQYGFRRVLSGVHLYAVIKCG